MHRDLKSDKVKTNRRKKSEFDSHIEFFIQMRRVDSSRNCCFFENNIIPFVCFKSASKPKSKLKLHAVDRWYWPAKEECGEETSRWCFFSTFLFGPTGDFEGLVYLRDTPSLEAGTYTSRKRHFQNLNSDIPL